MRTFEAIVFFVFMFFVYPLNIIAQKADKTKIIESKLKEKYGFASYHDTEGGWYTVQKDDKEGGCNLNGDEVIPPLYDKVYFCGTYYRVVNNGLMAIFDTYGKIILNFKYEGVNWWEAEEHGFCAVKKNGKYGVIDKKGLEIVPCAYDDVNAFECKDHKCCEVTLNGKKGLCNLKGKLVVPCEYDDIYSFQYGENKKYIVVKRDGKKGLVTRDGNLIIPCKYANIYSWDLEKTNYACVEKEINHFGIVTNKGEEILPCEYTEIWITSNDFAIITKGGSIPKTGCAVEGGKKGIYNPTSRRWICQPKYDYIRPAEEGLAAVSVGCTITSDKSTYTVKCDGGKWGYIDMNGNEIIAIQYDGVSSFEDGVAKVKKKGITSIIQHPLNGTSLEYTSGGMRIEVDTDIPQVSKIDEETFAFIISNESYNNYVASCANHDGKIFKEYCEKRLGIPTSNIQFYENATLGNFSSIQKRIKDLADAYDGEINFIFYFSGLGATDTKTKERYLLPSDISLQALDKTGVKLRSLNETFSNIRTKNAFMIIDAPFSGSDRDGKPLASNRGVSIKPNTVMSGNNVIMLLASSNDENVYTNKKQGHGLLTERILAQLKNNKVGLTLNQLCNQTINEVKRMSLQLFNNIQCPIVVVSPTNNDWKNIKF